MAKKPDHILWVYGGTLVTNFNVDFMDAMQKACEKVPDNNPVVTREAYNGLGELMPGKAALHVLDKRWSDMTHLWRVMKQEATKQGLDLTQLCHNGGLTAYDNVKVNETGWDDETYL